MVSPIEEIDLTFPACTSERKNGLNATVTRGGALGLVMNTAPKLKIKRKKTTTQNQGRRCTARSENRNLLRGTWRLSPRHWSVPTFGRHTHHRPVKSACPSRPLSGGQRRGSCCLQRPTRPPLLHRSTPNGRCA